MVYVLLLGLLVKCHSAFALTAGKVV